MTDIATPKFQPSVRASPGSITRAEWDRLSAVDQHRAVREGWRIIDAPPVPPAPVTISRAAFDKMPPAGQALFTGRGGTVAA